MKNLTPGDIDKLYNTNFQNEKSSFSHRNHNHFYKTQNVSHNHHSYGSKHVESEKMMKAHFSNYDDIKHISIWEKMREVTKNAKFNQLNSKDSISK